MPVRIVLFWESFKDGIDSPDNVHVVESAFGFHRACGTVTSHGNVPFDKQRDETYSDAPAPRKQLSLRSFSPGLLAPGTRLPIRPPAALREDTPDYALLLTWNHADAIIAQEQELIARGLRFITFMPNIEIHGEKGYERSSSALAVG